MQYSWQGFSYLQNWMANAVLRSRTVPTAQIAAMTVPYAFKALEVDEYLSLLHGCFALFMILLQLPILYRTSYRLASEKQSRVRETMRIMGLSDRAYWSSWFAYYLVI